MKQVDAMNAIIGLWNKREQSRKTKPDVISFYSEIKNQHPELLGFKFNGDKYQKIMAWLRPYTSQ